MAARSGEPEQDGSVPLRTNTGDAATRVRLPRLAHPRALWSFLLVTVLLAAGSFYAGTLVRAPQAALTEAAGVKIPVYARAEDRVVATGLSAQGTVVTGPEQKISGTSITAAGRPVVTSVAKRPGDSVRNRDLLATVADRPLFVLTLRIPLYRDLVKGDTGTDVRSLQDALGVRRSGTLDDRTLAAFARMYRSNHVTAAVDSGGDTRVVASEIQEISDGDGLPQVTSIAYPGQVLTNDVPLAVLSLGPSRVSFRANVATRELINVGDTVSIGTVKLGKASGTITAIGGYHAGEGTGDPGNTGYDTTVEFTDAAAAQRFAVGTTVTVGPGAEAAPALAVPQLAVRQDNAGSYVLRRSESGPDTRVTIVVGVQADGWAAVTSDELHSGDDVLVQP